jgi:hypothetical protein
MIGLKAVASRFREWLGSILSTLYPVLLYVAEEEVFESQLIAYRFGNRIRTD